MRFLRLLLVCQNLVPAVELPSNHSHHLGSPRDFGPPPLPVHILKLGGDGGDRLIENFCSIVFVQTFHGRDRRLVTIRKSQSFSK